MTFLSRLLDGADFDAVQELFAQRKTFLGQPQQLPKATYSLKNYWLNPGQPNYELRGVFRGEQLITTLGAQWSTELPVVYVSKVVSIDSSGMLLPSSFVGLMDLLMENIEARGWASYLLLTTEKYGRAFDVGLKRQSRLKPRFTTSRLLEIPAGQLTGIEHVDLHLLHPTPLAVDTVVNEVVLLETD